jgi:RimJ/RimL family protein N-acetyltransferase
MIITKTITNDKKKYKLYFCDVYGLVDFFKLDEKIISNFENIMKAHRPIDQNFKYTKIFNEDIMVHHKYKFTVWCQFIYDPKNYEIMTMGRIGIDDKKKIVELSMIHTNENYRGQKFCQKNINNFIGNILSCKNYTGIKKFSLDVRETNIPAIKCYEKCGFVIKSKDKEHYQMEKIIQ